jgi:hypothetical protein
VDARCLIDWPKSQEAISADISFVAAGDRRDFRRYALPVVSGDFGGQQAHCEKRLQAVFPIN